VVMGCLEFVDNLAADDENDDDTDDPVPLCMVCGGEVGIFVRYSLNWRHYQTTAEGSLELFDPGHEPEVGWRTAPGESPRPLLGPWSCVVISAAHDHGHVSCNGREVPRWP
jgi:hypothetical protein